MQQPEISIHPLIGRLPRMFDLIINEDGIPFIETKNEKVSHKISLTEAFKQAGKKIEYTIEG